MEKIKGFDGIRAICAFMVLYSHSIFSITHIPENNLLLKIYWAGFSGGAGVLVFFVLSGYLISQLLWAERLKTGAINYGNFIMRRVLRLLPLYLVYLGVLTIMVIAGFIDIKAIALASALTYTYNFLPATFGSGHTNHLWSLSVEEQFYLLFPLLMKKLPQRFMQGGIILIIIMGVVLINLIAEIPLPDYTFVHKGETENLSNVGLTRIFRFSTLLIPAGLYCLTGCLFGLTQGKLKTLLYGTRVRTAFVLPVALLLYFNNIYMGTPAYGVNQVVQSLGVGMFLVYVHHRQNELITKILCLPPLPYLGKISYGTYVWHGLFIGTGPGVCIYWWQGGVIGFVFSYLVSAISFELLEKPFLRLKKRFR